MYTDLCCKNNLQMYTMQFFSLGGQLLKYTKIYYKYLESRTLYKDLSVCGINQIILPQISKKNSIPWERPYISIKLDPSHVFYIYRSAAPLGTSLSFTQSLNKFSIFVCLYILCISISFLPITMLLNLVVWSRVFAMDSLSFSYGNEKTIFWFYSIESFFCTFAFHIISKFKT